MYQLRLAMKTEDLMNIRGRDHEHFDAASTGFRKVAGLPEDRAERKGLHSVSNIMAVLMTSGDCREHAALMLAFFAAWQSLQVNRKLLEAHSLLRSLLEGGRHRSGRGLSSAFDDERRAFSDIVVRAVPAMLRTQLRAANVKIFAPVQMVEKYKPVLKSEHGAEDNESGRHVLRQYPSEYELSEYERKHSLLRVEYTDGYVDELSNSFVEAVQVSDSQVSDSLDTFDKHSAYKDVQLSHTASSEDLRRSATDQPDDTAEASNAQAEHEQNCRVKGCKVCEHGAVKSTTLFNFVEEHTMTFLVETMEQTPFSSVWADLDSAESKPYSKISLADVFYSRDGDAGDAGGRCCCCCCCSCLQALAALALAAADSFSLAHTADSFSLTHTLSLSLQMPPLLTTWGWTAARSTCAPSSRTSPSAPGRCAASSCRVSQGRAAVHKDPCFCGSVIS